MSGLWLTDTSGLRLKSHFWGIQAMPDNKITLYSACGLFADFDDMRTNYTMPTCARCRLVKQAKRRQGQPPIKNFASSA